jgi:hypothetical protein
MTISMYGGCSLLVQTWCPGLYHEGSCNWVNKYTP